jgi:hypothetical protein
MTNIQNPAFWSGYDDRLLSLRGPTAKPFLVAWLAPANCRLPELKENARIIRR